MPRMNPPNGGSYRYRAMNHVTQACEQVYSIEQYCSGVAKFCDVHLLIERYALVSTSQIILIEVSESC